MTVLPALSSSAAFAGPAVSEGPPLHYASLTDVAKLIEARKISPTDLTRLFPDCPEAITNAAAIAERCRYQIPRGRIVPPPPGGAG